MDRKAASDAQRRLWLRRIETDMNNGRSPSETYRLIQAMFEAQEKIDVTLRQGHVPDVKSA